MATEKFKMSFTCSISSSLENGTQTGSGSKLYQRETIFGKADGQKAIPFKSLSFANGDSSVTAEKDGIVFTVTLENKDLIIEAETVGDNGNHIMNASLSDIFHSLPTVYDENGNVVDPDTKFVTATGGVVAYISIPNMASEGGAPK